MRCTLPRRGSLAFVSAGMLLLATGAVVGTRPAAFAAEAVGSPASVIQQTATDTPQRAQEDQAQQQAAAQAVSNELQQTESLELQTLNEERPPQLQQIEP